MKSTSISRIKNFKHCPLSYLYTYVDKFTPVEKQPIWVQTKGLVLHQTFENVLKYENYPDGTLDITDEKELAKIEPVLPYRVADNETVLKIFKQAMEDNNFPIEKAKEFNLKLGLKRWLDFKHNFLDKNGHIMYAEKEYKEVLFGETKTTTILDLLEDCGDGNYIIYDYKTPASIDMDRYKSQLILYAYTMACVKGIIKAGSSDYDEIVKHFKLKVFFPLVIGKFESYEKCLVDLQFTANDIKTVMDDVIKSCSTIDGFDFTRPAEILQLPCPDFQCKWCTFYGSLPQPNIKSQGGRAFEGCPITAFAGVTPNNTEFEPVIYEEKKPEVATNQ